MSKNNVGTINGLRRIEGQVRGVAQMLTDDRYCIDVLHQIQTVKAALAKVERAVLKSRAARCVHKAIISGEAKEQGAKFNERIYLWKR